MTQKIIYTHVKDFRGIKDFEAKDFGRFVTIFGPNGSGKTSFIAAIKNAIELEQGGNSKVKIGAIAGEIEVHFEDFKIRRVVGKKSSLEVEHNGELVKRPQEWLDNIFKGCISDPQKFINLGKKDKVRYMLDIFGKKEEYDKLESERVVLFDKNTDTHRTLLAKRDEIKKTDKEEFKVLDEAEDSTIGKLQEQLSAAEKHNETYHTLKSDWQLKEDICGTSKKGLKEIEEDQAENDNDIAELEQKLKIARDRKIELINGKNQLQQDYDKESKERDDAYTALSKFEKIDTTEVIAQINEHNKDIQTRADIKARKNVYDNQVKQEEILAGEWSEAVEAIAKIEGQQNILIESLNTSYNMKIEEGVMKVQLPHEDAFIPMEDMNTAAQLDLAVDICLGGPNEIKIITIENANALDPQTMEKIKKKVEEKGAQCFLETVYKTDFETITIEDGENVDIPLDSDSQPGK